MTRKEFREELLKIKKEWEKIAEEDPTYYHRSVHVVVKQDTAYIEAEFEGKNTKEFVLNVKLEDGRYRVYAKVEEYINPIDDIMEVLYNNNIEFEVVEVEDF